MQTFIRKLLAALGICKGCEVTKKCESLEKTNAGLREELYQRGEDAED